MRRALASVTLALALLAAPAAAAERSRIVVYEDSVSDPGARTSTLERSHGFRAEHRYAHALRGFSARLSDRQAARLAARSDVLFVSDDRAVQATADSTPTGVNRIDAELGVNGPASVNVAVIDTGVQLTHPDLVVSNGKSCIKGKKNANDDNGHGTHVAGTIGARANGSGVVGVAPGTRVYAVKVLNSAGSGSWSGVICGIDWVTANVNRLNIRVANMSLSGFGFADGLCGALIGDALNAAICRSADAGVTYAVAAGNSAQDFSTSVPAAYPEVLTVTAMSDSDGIPGSSGGAPTCRTGESDDTYATFSNYADPIDSGGLAHMVAAPGVCIESTWIGSGYRTISGTSMASPHGAGTAALCLSGPCAGMTPPQVIDKLVADAQAHSTADPGYGFSGHPSRAFGPLLWAGGY